LLGFPTIYVAITPSIPSILRDLGNLFTIPTGRQRVVKDNVHAFPAQDQARRQRYQIKVGVSFDKLWKDTWIHHAKDNHTFRLEVPLRSWAGEGGALVFVSEPASSGRRLYRLLRFPLAEWKLGALS
jgi:hypothetical protein